MPAEYRRLSGSEDTGRRGRRLRGAAACFGAAALLLATAAAALAWCGGTGTAPAVDRSFFAAASAVRLFAERVGPLGFCVCALAPQAAAALGRREQLRTCSVTLWESAEKSEHSDTSFRFVARFGSQMMFACALAEMLSPLPGTQPGRTLQAGFLAAFVNASEIAGNDAASNGTSGNSSTASSTLDHYGVLMKGELRSHIRAVLCFFGVAILVFLIIRYLLPRALEKLAHCLIERLDRIKLGTDVYLDKISFSVFHRSFTVEKFRVANWPGFNDRDHLLTIDKVDVGASIFAMACSRGKTVDLRWLHLDGLEIFVESKQDSSLSNIVHMVEFIDGVKRDASGKQIAAGTSKRQYVIHEIRIRKIQVSLPKSATVGSLQLRCADLYYPSFQDIALKHDITTLPAVVRFVMTIVLRESSKGRGGERIKQIGKDVGARALVGAKKAEQDIKKVLHGGMEQAQKMFQQTGALWPMQQSGAMNVHPFSEVASSSHGLASEASVDQATLDRLANLRRALRMSGLEPKFLCPSGGLQEHHFRQLAEMTCCFPDDMQDGEISLGFSALCTQLGKRKLIPPADFVQWLADA